MNPGAISVGVDQVGTPLPPALLVVSAVSAPTATQLVGVPQEIAEAVAGEVYGWAASISAGGAKVGGPDIAAATGAQRSAENTQIAADTRARRAVAAFAFERSRRGLSVMESS